VSARLRAQQQYAQLSRKVLLAQEAERLRLSRDLHDELGQLLTAIRLELGWLQKLPAHAEQDGATIYRNSVELVEKAAEELRRICKGLRPPLLDDLGLVPAVRQLVEEFRERTGLEIALALPQNEQRAGVPTEAALCTYRILQESLTNISRHAAARSVDVALSRSPGELGLSVYDDGTGFELSRLDQTEGSGLAGMRERALLVGGTLTIRSARSQGTRIVLRIPLPPSPADVAT
jgi:signal transduction histidine kinase